MMLVVACVKLPSMMLRLHQTASTTGIMPRNCVTGCHGYLHDWIFKTIIKSPTEPMVLSRTCASILM